jgi:hypothetical protein
LEADKRQYLWSRLKTVQQISSIKIALSSAAHPHHVIFSKAILKISKNGAEKGTSW